MWEPKPGHEPGTFVLWGDSTNHCTTILSLTSLRWFLRSRRIFAHNFCIHAICNTLSHVSLCFITALLFWISFFTPLNVSMRISASAREKRAVLVAMVTGRTATDPGLDSPAWWIHVCWSWLGLCATYWAWMLLFTIHCHCCSLAGCCHMLLTFSWVDGFHDFYGVRLFWM